MNQKDQSKRARQEEIVKMITSGEIVSGLQDFVYKLKRRGFEANRSTIHRDLKQLKIVLSEGKYRFDVKEISKIKLKMELQEKVLDIFEDVGLFAIKTELGYSRSTAALIEEVFKDRVHGVIAAENMAIIVARSFEASEIAKEIEQLITEK